MAEVVGISGAQFSDAVVGGVRRQVEHRIRELQFRFGMQVAQFEALNAVAVAVQVDVKPFSEPLSDLRSGRFHKGVEFRPGLFGVRVAVGCFFEVAVGIQFAAVQAVHHEVWVAAAAFVEGLRQGAAQLLGIKIIDVGAAAAIPVGYTCGRFFSAMRRGKQEWQRTRNVLDVFIGTEIGLSGCVIALGAEPAGEREEQEEQEEEVDAHWLGN